MKVSIDENGILNIISETREENKILIEWFKKSEIPLYDDFPIICYVHNRNGFLDQVL